MKIGKHSLCINKNGLKLDFSGSFLSKWLSTTSSRRISYHYGWRKKRKESLKIVNLKLVFIYPRFSPEIKKTAKRLIIHLTNLNQYIIYEHFKMESVQDVINTLEQSVFVASRDLKNVFFSVPIYNNHQSF